MTHLAYVFTYGWQIKHRRVRHRVQTRPTPLLVLIYCRCLSMRRLATWRTVAYHVGSWCPRLFLFPYMFLFWIYICRCGCAQSCVVLRHPAPLPPVPMKSSVPPGAKCPPPKPTLKLSRVANGLFFFAFMHSAHISNISYTGITARNIP